MSSGNATHHSGEHPNAALTAEKLFSVSGFKAVVTGGGTGIGLMITQALVANGATVYITGRRQEALDTAVKHYSKQGGPNAGDIIGITADITNRDDLNKLVEEISRREPNGIHLLVNNAGVALEKDTTRLTEENEPDWRDANSVGRYLSRADQNVWRDTFDINITAQYFTAAAFVPLLGKAQKTTPKYSPSIINIASVSGVTKKSSSGQFAYSTSKAAVLHLTQVLAATLTQSKIRVNCIAPGLFPSEMTTNESDEKNKSTIEKNLNIPAGRPGKDQDIAAAVLYLGGLGGVYLNGQVVYPDGGIALTTPSTA